MSHQCLDLSYQVLCYTYEQFDDGPNFNWGEIWPNENSWAHSDPEKPSCSMGIGTNLWAGLTLMDEVWI